MPEYEVVWHGAIVGYVNAWSQTKGELMAVWRSRYLPRHS